MKRHLLSTLIVTLFCLLVGIPRATALTPIGSAFTYQGHLNDGGSPANGSYDFEFKLYDAASSGGQVGGTVTKEDVDVASGRFTVELDFGNVFDGATLWLDIGVRPGSSTGAFTPLSPRQALMPTPYALYALSAGSTPWSGLDGVPAGFADGVDNEGGLSLPFAGTVSSGDTAFSITNNGSGAGVYGLHTATTGTEPGVRGETGSTSGYAAGVMGRVTSTSPGGYSAGVRGINEGAGGAGIGVWGSQNGSGWGVYGTSAFGTGVYGIASSSSGATSGIYGKSASTDGRGAVGWATATSGSNRGVYGRSDSSDGIGVYGLHNATSGTEPGVLGETNSVGDGAVGVLGRVGPTIGSFTAGVSGINESTGVGAAGVHGAHTGGGRGVSGASVNGVGVYAYSASGNPIEAYSASDREFYVSNNGNVYADGSYYCGQSGGGEPGTCIIQGTPADFAEMLPATPNLEPGDVLVIGSDGLLTRSTQAYQATVVGVYSTQPGYLGGGQHLGRDGYVPLAVIGVVPVKASAENGTIQPGDLLVASSTPGRAMRCEGVERCFGRTIGKALAGLDEGTAVIQMLVILQ